MAPAGWDQADGQLRRPEEVLALGGALPWDPAAVEAAVTGPFWEVLEGLGATLLVTREYEHFVAALACPADGPATSVLRVPHPSGLVVDRDGGRVHVACTRNPNQVMELAPSAGWLPRADRPRSADRPGLVPVRTRFYPGCLYLHDLAMVAGRLLANAVGMNAVVALDEASAVPVWWPASMDAAGGAELSENLIQLNSIAAGDSIEGSFFTASSEAAGPSRPGDLDWAVERGGVIFAGDTRRPVVRGLTRPHSARLAPDGRLWVDDSGFGTVDVVDAGRAEPVAQLPGWTRGLCFLDRYAVVGTSRVIPRFARYAPGLEIDTSVCGLHLVDVDDGGVVASLTWPGGNQIFAIDWFPNELATGFLAGSPEVDPIATEAAWYQFRPPSWRAPRSDGG
jgi:uncharacterized protein (TIGR03032 family)